MSELRNLCFAPFAPQRRLHKRWGARCRLRAGLRQSRLRLVGSSTRPRRPIVLENVTMRLRVQCYAGRKADERPLRFQLNDHEYVVEEVVDRWYGPEHAFFKVRANDGNLYIIRHQASVPDGGWELVSFRQTKPA